MGCRRSTATTTCSRQWRELVQNKGIGESADNLWRRVGAFLPTSGQQEPMKELPPVSDGNGANIPKFPLPSGADHATTPMCAFAGNHTWELLRGLRPTAVG